MCKVQLCSGTAFRSNEFPIIFLYLRASYHLRSGETRHRFSDDNGVRRCNKGNTHISHRCVLFVALGRLYNRYLGYYTVSGCYYFYIAMCIFF